jgi:cell division protein FtsW (lipid II flippase)
VSLGAGRLRRTAAFTLSFLAAVLGILGTIITILVTLSDHSAAHGNENFFMLNPFWLFIAVVTPMIILRPRPRRVARRVIAIALGLACVALLSHLVGLSHQSNWDVILLILPVELAIGWVLLSAARTPAPSASAL